MKRILRPTIIGLCFALCVLFILSIPGALALGFKDVTSFAAAHTTYLFFHEMGHQVVVEEPGADSTKMCSKNGRESPPAQFSIMRFCAVLSLVYVLSING